MKTQPGGTYRIHVITSSGDVTDPSWMVGSIAGAYPIDVLSITPVPPSDASIVVRWHGPAGAIDDGDEIQVELPGVTSTGTVSPTLTVLATEDLNSPASKPASVGWSLLAAAAILAATTYFSYRVSQYGV